MRVLCATDAAPRPELPPVTRNVLPRIRILRSRHTPCAATGGRHTECACYFNSASQRMRPNCQSQKRSR
jgi:hypothetical protein